MIKTTAVIALMLIAAISTAMSTFVYFHNHTPLKFHPPNAASAADQSTLKSVALSTPSVQINSTTIPVELATDAPARQKGLSGRLSLAPEQGMLFIFSTKDFYRFWMPDMHFPLDMIWITDGHVIGIDRDVSNDFNPAHPRFYIPPQPVTHVLEVNAGFSRQHNIHIGDPALFRANE